MKGFCRDYAIILFCIAVFLSSVLYVLPGEVRAAGASFSLYPSTGYALLGKNFSVDIMLDTGGEETSLAAAVFRYNPDKVRVTKAEHGDLYCQYPDDQYTVDNTLGWVKLTGYCTDPTYTTLGNAELFGRITFVPLLEGPTTFQFVESYSDSEWESKMLDNGSPPMEITGISYTGGTYTVVTSIDQPDDGDGGKLPGVGLFDNKIVVYALGLIGLAGVVLIVDRVIRVVGRKESGDKGRIIVR